MAHDLVVRCDGKCVFQYAYANDRFIDVVPRLKLNQYYTLERQNLGGAGALVGAGSSERMETMKASLEYGLDHFLRGCGWGLVNELPRIRHGCQLSFVGRTAGLVLALLRAWFVSRLTFSCRMTAARSRYGIKYHFGRLATLVDVRTGVIVIAMAHTTEQAGPFTAAIRSAAPAEGNRRSDLTQHFRSGPAAAIETARMRSRQETDDRVVRYPSFAALRVGHPQ